MIDKNFFSLESEDQTLSFTAQTVSFESLGFSEDVVTAVEGAEGLDRIGVATAALTQVETGNESIVREINFQNNIIAIEEKAAAADPEGDFSFESYAQEAVANSEVLADEVVSTEGFDFKATAANIWRGIVLGFKKIGVALGNLVKEIQVRVSALGDKSADKYYQANLANLKTATKSGATFNAILPKNKLDFAKILNNVSQAAQVITDASAQYLDKVGASVGDLKKMSKNADKEIAKKAKGLIKAEAAIFGKKINKAVTLNVKGVEYNAESSSFPAAASVVRGYIWGDVKPKATDVKVKDYLGKVDFDILSTKSSSMMKSLVGAAITSAKVSASATKGAEAMAKSAIEIATAIDGKKSEAAVAGMKEGLSYGSKHANIAKVGLGYSTALILNTYKEFFRARGFVKAAVKAGAGKAPKAGKKDKKDKKDDK